MPAMLMIQVRVHVKPDFVDAVTAATIENARNSVNEPGIARFDILQHADDPTWFTLNEVYRNAEAPAAHKETRHYQVWRNAVQDMMAEPRSSIRLTTVFPPDGGW
jgi:(4S)-4-hydroxy-5-phosphonooxypentane-2,3-dione isomerase